MNRPKIQIVHTLLICACVASIFSAIKVFKFETPKRVISGSAASNDENSDLMGFDWMIMQSPGANGNLIVIKPVRKSQPLRSYESLAEYYHLQSNGIVFNDYLIEIPKLASRVIIDSETGIYVLDANTNRSKRAIAAVIQRAPTFTDLAYLHDRAIQ